MSPRRSRRQTGTVLLTKFGSSCREKARCPSQSTGKQITSVTDKRSSFNRGYQSRLLQEKQLQAPYGDRFGSLHDMVKTKKNFHGYYDCNRKSKDKLWHQLLQLGTTQTNKITAYWKNMATWVLFETRGGLDMGWLWGSSNFCPWIYSKFYWRYSVFRSDSEFYRSNKPVHNLERMHLETGSEFQCS